MLAEGVMETRDVDQQDRGSIFLKVRWIIKPSLGKNDSDSLKALYSSLMASVIYYEDT